ncbi:MAG TPA: MFS transporter [Kofleriaceae bacterium]|jgi:predicted MFS family arabinose efflux permease|nr:MFS transporter [Kofleriaceae bacterium]
MDAAFDGNIDGPEPPARSRVRSLAVVVAGFSTFLGLYAPQPLLGHFEHVFAASKAVVALTVSAPTAAVALFAPLVGVIADRTGRRRLIVASLVVLAAVTALAATAPGLGTLIAWRFAEGVAIPGAYVVCLSYLTEEVSPRALGGALGAMVTGNVLGGFSGRVIAGVITEASGWRAAFVVLGAIRLAGALVVWRVLPASRRFTPRRHQPVALSRVRGLAAPALLASFAVGFCTLFSLVALFTYAGFYLAAPPFRLGPGAIGALFTVYLVGVVVTPIAGRWVDSVGARRVIAAAFSAGAAGAALTLVPSIVAVLAGLAIAASATFVAQVAATSYLRIAAPAPLRSLASGVYVTCYYIGGSVAGVLPGVLWARAGWAGTVGFAVVAQLVAIAVSSRGWIAEGDPRIVPAGPRGDARRGSFGA